MYRADDRAFCYTARPALEIDHQFWVVGRVGGEVDVVQMFREGDLFRQRRPSGAFRKQRLHGDYDYPARTTKAQLHAWWQHDFDDGRYELAFDAGGLVETLEKWYNDASED